MANILRTDRSVYYREFQEVWDSLPSANEMAERRRAIREPEFERRMDALFEQHFAGRSDVPLEELQQFYDEHSLQVGVALDSEGL